MTPLQRALEFKNTGNVYFIEGKYDEAIAQYNKAIDICPRMKETATFYQNRAAVNEQLKKYSDVRADCTKALELNPRYMKALLRRARASKQLGDLEAAWDDVTTVCTNENFSNQTCNAMASKILKKLVKQFVQENLTNKKFIMPSKEFIRKYTSSFPNDPVFSRLQKPENIPEFLRKPLRALKDKKYDDIIPLCTKIIKKPEFDTLPSTKLEVLLLRATFYVLLGKYDSAIQDFERILSSEDASDDVKTNALIKRAALYTNLENLEMAFKDFELAINMNPSYSEIYYFRGAAYLTMNKFDEAKHNFDKAIEYDPNFCIGYMQKYYFEYHMKEKCNLFSTNVLAEEVARAFEKYPNSSGRAYCYTMYAEILIQNKQYEDADTYLVKAIEKDPENALIHAHRAELLLLWDDIEKAKEHLNKALDLDEKCELVHVLLGRIAVQEGKLEKAIRLFDKAVALCPIHYVSQTSTEEMTDTFYLRENAKLQLKLKKLKKKIIDINNIFPPCGHL
ncbi:PREDICTED: mitochondrial import receptor subunit TOM70-like isoform X2 [Wasmannia auropunctata]|uniref:mitochondrial import receptor subunit TOM70-like isoform X2 n=1 Tax=Wasmannia auropunctata TaxID=64793 RepID=UPI0005EE36B8|nr:PREDICTED: mitochondrial import receptor subunit TOM70-like isoform X2 [Wasmannia auropunctata]